MSNFYFSFLEFIFAIKNRQEESQRHKKIVANFPRLMGRTQLQFEEKLKKYFSHFRHLNAQEHLSRGVQKVGL